MSEAVIVALITGAVMLLWNIITAYYQNQKTIYRIEQLEKKQDRYNNIQERVLANEKDITKYENFTKYNQINFEQCNEYENCPICNKIFYTFSEKVKFIHIKECLKKFENY